MAAYERGWWGTDIGTRTQRSKGGQCRGRTSEGTMTTSTDGKLMSPKLMRVMERAKQYPEARFNSLAHLLDGDALARAFHRIRRNAAAGMDGITKDEYGQHLEQNLQELLGRLKSMRYRHQPIRRAYIPKSSGGDRPIGISSIEDKIVQGAIREVLETIYEQDFRDCSYGFRPGRSAHDGLRALDRMVYREGMTWILEADIQAFFDSLDRTKLKEMLGIRVADGRMMRLIGKCLKVGVLDGEEFSMPEEGTVQGSVISPLLGNVYLHYVLDRWFEDEIRPHVTGATRLIRYCDDFVIGFARKEDAERVLTALVERFAEYGLTLHPEKTRLIPFTRPNGSGKGKGGSATFDFLGFTMFWRRKRRGGWMLGMKTRKASLRKAVKAIHDWCRRHRHLSRAEQHVALSRRLHGHYNYFGVNGNVESLARLMRQTERSWFKWLRRRSHRARRLTWGKFGRYLKAFPLPAPRIRVRIWGTSP